MGTLAVLAGLGQADQAGGAIAIGPAAGHAGAALANMAKLTLAIGSATADVNTLVIIALFTPGALPVGLALDLPAGALDTGLVRFALVVRTARRGAVLRRAGNKRHEQDPK